VGRRDRPRGGGVVALSTRTRIIAEQIATDERAHVLFLRSALGRQAVAKPAVNLEALGLGFRTEAEFIGLARAFEDVGVSAEGGAARLIDNARLLEAATQVALTEAQHAGVLRLVVSDAGAPVPLVDNMDIPPLGTPAGRLFQVEARGLSTIRSAGQVLAILYASAIRGTNRRSTHCVTLGQSCLPTMPQPRPGPTAAEAMLIVGW
jgi:hypothetical protein